MSPTMLICVALGGAVGAVGRYLMTSSAGQMFGHGFPLGTMIVNVVGAFILGALIEIFALVWSPSEEMRAFLVIGALGAFTTFSTFSLDIVTLLTRGQVLGMAAYISGSVVLSVLGLYLGMALFRQILS